MNARIISALVAKDLLLFFRNRFFALITVLGLVFYAVIYFLLPAEVDELLTIGVYGPTFPPEIAKQMEEIELEILRAPSIEALQAAILEGEYNVGAVFPADLASQLASGQRGEMTLYFGSDLPVEVMDYYTMFFREIGYQLSGETINIEAEEVILGPDMAGAQIPQRDRMLPLFAIVVLLTETLGLATLISSEVDRGTLRALLITPMKVRELFAGKMTTGVGLAFFQAAFLMAVMGGLAEQPAAVLLALLLGSVLVTGLAFLMGSAARDMMGVIGWGVPAIVILSIPSFGVVFPGSVSSWVQIIPSYYLVDAVHQLANLGAGWGDVWQNLAILLGFDLALVPLGLITLQRKMR